MTISSGDTLPTATLLRIGADGPETVDLGARLTGRNTVIFGLPGAFLPQCRKFGALLGGQNLLQPCRKSFASELEFGLKLFARSTLRAQPSDRGAGLGRHLL